jgi:hypothetical protein
VLSIDAAVLSRSASSLTELRIGLKWDASALSSLARVVPQMQQLQSLCLSYNEYSSSSTSNFINLDRYPAPVLGAEECALLLSPAKLTSLSLGGIALTPNGFDRMLAAGSTTLVEFNLSYSDWKQQYTPPVTSSGLGRLVSAWPQLQRLGLTGAVAVPSHQATAAAVAEGLQHAGWPALQQLTALTCLRVGGDSDKVVRDLASLTQLKQLSLHSCRKVTGPGLLQLTQLTALSWLNVTGYNSKNWARDDPDDDDDIPRDIYLTCDVSYARMCVFEYFHASGGAWRLLALHTTTPRAVHSSAMCQAACWVTASNAHANHCIAGAIQRVA